MNISTHLTFTKPSFYFQFAILTDGNKGCDITTIQDKIEWCNGTISSANLVPGFTACQVEDQYESHLLCRNGEWSKENREYYTFV